MMSFGLGELVLIVGLVAVNVGMVAAGVVLGLHLYRRSQGGIS